MARRHPPRNALDGSNAAALRAGSHDDTAAMTKKDEAHREKGDRIGRPHPDQHRRHRPSQDERTGEAERDAASAQAEAVPDHEPKNLCGRGANGHADADLGDPLPDDRREHTVETDRDEQRRCRREHGDQCQREPRAGLRAPDEGLRWQHVCHQDCGSIDPIAARIALV